MSHPTCTQQIHHILSLNRQGSAQTRTKRKKVLLGIVADWSALGCLPTSFTALMPEHVIQDAASYYDLAIGFSIGGTILWKAVENYGLTLSKLICIFSTRLRFEKSRLNPKTSLVYGVLDEYAPEQCLAMKLADKHKIIPQVGHDFYRHNPTLLKQTLITLMQENGLPL